MTATDELRTLAARLGVATSFEDATGRCYEPSAATLEAVLAGLGVDPGAPPPAPPAVPPVVVVRAGRRTAAWPPPAAPGAVLVLESGEERPLRTARRRDLPLGYHRVESDQGSTLLVVAPPRCHLPASLGRGRRAWGWAVQLYALRSRASWGIGDL